MLKKIVKDKTEFTYKKTLNYDIFFPSKFQTEEIFIFLKEIKDNLKNVEYIKNFSHEKTSVAILNLPQGKYAIKSYYIRSVWNWIKTQFRKSRGLRSFFQAQYLQDHDIPAIKPIALIQKKYWIFKTTSFFISQYENGIAGCTYFNDNSFQKNEWQETIDAIIKTTQKLDATHFYHGDYHFGNFLIVDKKPILLDFDHSRVVKNKKRFLKLHQKEIKNFFRYLKRNTSATEMFDAHAENPFR